MAEAVGVTQALELNSDTVQQASKRKPDASPIDGSDDDPRRVSKNPRLDQDQNTNKGHDSSVDNGGEKEIVVDKGKAEVIMQEEEKGSDQSLNHGAGAVVDKGKGKIVVQKKEGKLDRECNPSPKAFVDKGKGKMIVEDEEEEDSSDDSDDEAGVASGSDSDFSDDPLMEVDLNNILPSRTRRWAPPVPGAYLVPPDQDDDEDDEDDDVSDDGVADVDDDDDEDDDGSESE